MVPPRAIYLPRAKGRNNDLAVAIDAMLGAGATCAQLAIVAKQHFQEIAETVALFEKNFATFDGLIDRIEALFPELHQVYRHPTGEPDRPGSAQHRAGQCRLVDRAASCGGIFIRAGEEQGERSFPPFKLVELDGASCGPVPSRHVEIGASGKNAERDILAAIEALRADYPVIGGFAQLATLTQRDVSQRILRRWTA